MDDRPRETCPLIICRLCRGVDGTVVLDLGRQPSCEVYPSKDAEVGEVLYPLRMWLCSACGLAQLVEDPGLMEEQVQATEPRAMLDQTERTLGMLVGHDLLAAGNSVAEYGSPHSPSWIKRMASLGVRTTAADSTEHVDVVLDVYGLLHDPDQQDALRRRAARLAPGGTLVIQMHSLVSALASRQYSELRHGHFAYWSLPALADALKRVGLGIHRARRFPLDGGTLVVLANRQPDPDSGTMALVAAERAAGVLDAAAVMRLQADADHDALALRTWLHVQRASGVRVLGYGAASRAVPVLCHAAVNRSLLGAIGDAAPSKQARRMPGTDVPIVTPERLTEMRPDRVLLFLPDLLDEMRETLPGVEHNGGRWTTTSAVCSVTAERTDRPG